MANRVFGIAVCVITLATSSRGQGHAAGLDAISLYAGTWKTHIVHVKTAYSKPRTETATLHNDCWRSAGYYSCDQFVNGSSVALLVYTYDRKHNFYHSRVIAPDGSSAGSGTLLISGNQWVYPWQDKDGAKTVYIRIVNTFTDRNAIAFRQEYSFDRVHWTITARGFEHRTAGKGS